MAEMRAAVRWYEARQEGLGRRFYESVEATAKRAMQGELPGHAVPGAAPARPLRRVRVPRFPYMLYFERHQDDVVFLAVAHMSRRPGYFLRRKPDDIR